MMQLTFGWIFANFDGCNQLQYNIMFRLLLIRQIYSRFHLFKFSDRIYDFYSSLKFRPYNFYADLLLAVFN